MSSDPYQTPKEPIDGPPPGDAAARVNGPAIGLVVTAGVGLALQVLGLLGNLLGIGMGAGQMGGQDGAMLMMQGTLGIVSGLIGIAIGVVILMGALKMKKLESYGFAMAAAILAMIPCISPCCLLGIPFGIWALVVLLDESVKSSFT